MYFSGISPSSQNPLFCAQAITKTSAKRYSVLADTDSISNASYPRMYPLPHTPFFISNLLTAVATDYLNKAGLTMTAFYQFAITSTDTTFVNSLVGQALQNFTSQYELGDVLCVFTNSAYIQCMYCMPLCYYWHELTFSTTVIITLMNQLQPNISLAAFFVPTDVIPPTALQSV